ncbi:hypothetical protein MCC93_13970 [Morococcus cerebrosus]|uniref:Uncharacterized protein n=1 Tax=Morococcus cerebrosus TaxID=1056807 RepID=A0A0C1EFD5_9NEIS|nr:hypothetical protein MCC93_13970 [Morococcus cerebrosus]KJJ15779.1 hypothetical protein HMPREF3156_01675 [Neisseria sp. HMSC06F02]
MRQGRLKPKLRFSDDLVAYSQKIVGKTIVFFHNVSHQKYKIQQFSFVKDRRN